MKRLERILRAIDSFYEKSGPCCAGCDWWHPCNEVVGECRRSAPISGHERVSMLGFWGLSLRVGAGHALTRRDHCCGDFIRGDEQA